MLAQDYLDHIDCVMQQYCSKNQVCENFWRQYPLVHVQVVTGLGTHIQHHELHVDEDKTTAIICTHMHEL